MNNEVALLNETAKYIGALSKSINMICYDGENSFVRDENFLYRTEGLRVIVIDLLQRLNFGPDGSKKEEDE